ncbi:MAG TPA: hypothetical protein VN969_22505 [Streptosporangiaceae bacterium]|nr:hypothetical protein [Streptosporangiaceae bacterium]
MSPRWPELLDWALAHGPVVAALAALAVSPGAHILIASVLERRRLRANREFAALAVGDPLLALAVGVGVALSPHGVSAPVQGLVLGTGAVLIAGGWLCFGLWQWWDELRRGYYSRAQGCAPTKIWHQLGVYPLLGSLVCCAALSGLAVPLGNSALLGAFGKAVIVLLVLAWVWANLYDRRHPKLGHPPYTWRRLRPAPEPWPADSVTLQSHHNLRCTPQAARHAFTSPARCRLPGTCRWGRPRRSWPSGL